jgi:hypothetical protein
MSGDEQMVLQYLNSFPNLFVSAAEVSKRAADRRRFNANPEWARPALQLLTLQGVLEVNASGHYRTKPKHVHEDDELAADEKSPEPAAPSSTPEEASSELKSGQ